MVVKGKKLTFKEYLQKVKSEFQGMTPKQKLEHFWEYYKGLLLIPVALIFIIGVIVGSINSLGMELRLSGVLVNVNVSPEGITHLQSDYAQRIGAGEKELVDVRSMRFENPFTTLDQTYALNVQESVMALVSNQELDYLMFDELSLPFFLSPDTMLDLRELFSQEELDAMGMAVIRLQVPQTGEKIPVAIDIRDTVFYRQHMQSDDVIYLSFISNSSHKETCLDFWRFIKGGNTASLQTQLAATVIDAPINAEGLKILSQGFFESCGYVPGDDRVELTCQSFVQPEGETEDVANMVQENVRTMLSEGALDYFVADEAALQTLSDVALLDLRQIMTEAELTELADAVVYRGEVPVAVELSETAFGQYCTGKAYLSFNANTGRLETCEALWAHINP